MSDLKIYDDYNTLPEQVQINKDDITKLKDDISKIKPNAWEERKFNIDIEDSPLEFTTFNPITNTNAPINIQKSFTDKDTYAITDPVNSYSFSISASGIFGYVVCANPTITIKELLVDRLNSTTKNAIVFANLNTSDPDGYWLLINSKWLWTQELIVGTDSVVITRISNDYTTSGSDLLTAEVIYNNYLRKTDASNTYLTKTEASNTYVTKQDYDERYDTGDVTLTDEGFNKIKTMAEEVGTTITLNINNDFTEHIQLSNIRELILNVWYNDGTAIYKNIHLMPNQSVDDYDLHNARESTWYTGHAMLNLPSADNGYFAVSYQEGQQLVLTLIAHY